MVRVITAHEARMRPVAGRLCKHLDVESICFCLVDLPGSDLGRRKSQARQRRAVSVSSWPRSRWPAPHECTRVRVGVGGLESVFPRSGRRRGKPRQSPAIDPASLFILGGEEAPFTRLHKRLCTAGNACRSAISGFIRMLRRGYNGPKLTTWKLFCRTIERTAC